MSEKRKWQKVSSERVYETPHFWLTSDKVIQPDGQESNYGVYHTHGAIFIVALTTDGKYIFVQQDRYPIGAETTEVVAGSLPEGADPVEHTKVELREEVNAVAEHVEDLGFIWAAPPRMSTKIQVVVATGIDAASLHTAQQEGNEAINAVLIKTEAEVVGMIRDGIIKDNASLASLNLYWSKYGYPKT